MARFPKEIRTGIWIRNYLLENKEDYVYRMYKKFKRDVRRKGYTPGSYDNFRRYIHFCKKLGLIRMSRTEKMSKGFDRHYYVLVPKEIENPAWRNPQGSVYPSTQAK